MPAQTAGARVQGAGPTVAVVHVGRASSRADDAPRYVATELGERGRQVLAWHDVVSDETPAAWMRDLVERLTTQVLAPLTCPPPSTVHLFGWQAVVAASAARPITGQVLVAHLGDGPPTARPHDLEAQRVRRLVWAAARTMDAVVLDSAWAIGQALQAGVPRARIVRGLPVAPPVDCHRPWSPPQETGPRRVVAVGGVGRAAGTDVLIQAVGRLADVELVVAAPFGAPGSALEPAKRWMHAECRRHGFSGDAVRLEPFTPGLLEKCDAVVDAGTTAGAADGVVAAMSRRRAVLASDLGPKAEAVVAGTTGELVAVGGDWRAWCGHIVRLLRDPFKLEAYADAGFERSRVGFAPSRRADVIDHLDERLSRPLAVAS